MPELPEIETFVRTLRPLLVAKTILSADLRWERTLAAPSPAEFKQRVKGQQILAVSRRAKFFDLRLSTFDLIIHLRMSGDLLVKEGAYPSEKHDRLVLFLSDGLSLAFNDPRKFGRVWLTANPDEVLGRLGPEPLDPAFTADVLYERLRARKRQLKPLLLDQTFLAGMGNIYSDEALHLARLHPLKNANTITPAQAEALWQAILATLTAGIEHNGSSIDWVYRGGGFQNHFRVYGRDGQPCAICGTVIQRIALGQRGTHFCPNCQPGV